MGYGEKFTTSRLSDALAQDLFRDGDAAVAVRLAQPSAGGSAMSDVVLAYDGFDWDAGYFVLETEEELVSWSYLEKLRPGIRDEIEQARRAYERRPLRVIVAGCRTFGTAPDEREVIESEMRRLACPPYVGAGDVEIVSGCAPGVDTVSAEVARDLGYALREFPADWEALGRAAGHIRNQQMADYAGEDDHRFRGMLLAFWDGESHGTGDMVHRAGKAGLAVRIVRIDELRADGATGSPQASEE